MATTSPESAILGTGWSFPPTFSRRAASVVMVSDEENVRQSLWVLFSTQLGERVMLPNYGTGLWPLVFGNLTTSLKTELANDVLNAVLYWEPRIDVDGITIEPDPETTGRVLLTVDYRIRQTNARNNLVYPFYLDEGTLAGEAP
jgi:phage baseplate assembly protein W